MSAAIEFENISKQYRLGLVSTRTISHDLNRWWKMNIQGKEDPYLKIGEVNDRAHKGNSEYVWALKDINFKVEQGDVLGIIGKNGAGKSTLLKILSKVTAPTTGTIRARGRIASLLEVGTGFHPEMTGRENIYMNGAIMGMTKAEITRKLDEIVDFSGVERYIDTPVKRYSSGMTVRLGFAIAAHLEPEILVVDEVLAVGDAEFQKKAIGKMQDVSKGEGRTVLFVSHNMAAVSTLTTRAICLANGTLINEGKTQEIINFYLNETSPLVGDYISEPNQLKPNYTKICVITSESYGIHKNGEDLIIELEVNMPYAIEGMAISFQIFSENEQPIIYSYIFDSKTPILRTKGVHKYRCTIPSCKLYQGVYYIKAHLAESRGQNKFEEIDKICQFEVVMLGETIEWGWQKDVCIYTESFDWTELS
jgi:lipopolysaccharide transport system ATP-binding protein